MYKKVVPHIRPNISRLEPWREDIIIRRQQNWPYDKIVDWLQQNKKVQISREGLRKFCLIRHIKKGTAEPFSSPRPVRDRAAPPSQEKPIFEYYDNGPIEINR